MRVFTRLSIGLAGCILIVAQLYATTLEQLTLDDMIRQSTSIVRARVTGSRSAYKGSAIYTYFQVQVLETWKASGKPARPLRKSRCRAAWWMESARM